MLTENLIRDIDKGIAQYKTFVWGVAGAARLPVPRNSRIVITDLLINPFVDTNIDGGYSAGKDAGRTFSYQLASSMGRASFVIRHQVLPFLAGATTFSFMGAPVRIDTYLVHNEEVRLNIFKIEPTTVWVNSFIPLDDISKEPSPPVGYGTVGAAGLNVSKLIVMGATTQYIPAGIKNSPSLTASGQYVEQFGVESKAGSILSDPTTLGTGNNTYPIVNISYVLYENMKTPNVKGN